MNPQGWELRFWDMQMRNNRLRQALLATGLTVEQVWRIEHELPVEPGHLDSDQVTE